MGEGFNVPFSNFSAISAQAPFFFVLSVIESMGVRTRVSKGELNPGRRITSPASYRLS